MRIALAQINPTVGDVPGNAAACEHAIEQARAAGARLVVLPELCISGYPPKDLVHRPDFIRACAAAAKRIGQSCTRDLTAVIGTPLPLDAGGIANSLVVYRDNTFVDYYDKRLLPTYDVFDEDRYFVPGNRAVVIDIDGTPVGLAICEDLWRGEDAGFASRYLDAPDPVSAAVEAGARLLVVPSASPYVLGKHDRHVSILRTHARRHGVHVCSVNQVGGNDDLIFDGRACVIAPDGSIAARIAGAGNRELLTRTVAHLIESHPKRPPLPEVSVTRYRSATGLRFPSGVYAQVPSVGRPGRVFIADTAHHRIIETTWPSADGQCRVRTVFGGSAGNVDGPASRARFREPTGLAFDAENALLYVADTGNHAIRRIDLHDAEVSTIIGSGVRGFDRRGGATGTNQPLNTPTHLVLDAPRNRLFIAMTGLDQVWLADLDTLVTRSLAGTGAMKLVDGPFDTAAFWQPRALALDRDADTLYSLDADASALRRLHLPTRAVRTLIGSPEGYTGSRDGPLSQAQLCHPTGMTFIDADTDEHLLIADTYNAALRRVDLHAQSAARLAPSLPLFEPAAMHWSAGLPSRTEPPRLFVADTGHHRILQMDADARTWQELRIGGLHAMHQSPATPLSLERAAFNVPLRTPLRMEVALAPALAGAISPDWPVCVRVSTLDDADPGQSLFQSTRVPDPRALPVSIDLPADAVTERAVLLVELSLGLIRSPATPASPFFKAWRVRFGPDGGQPRLLAE